MHHTVKKFLSLVLALAVIAAAVPVGAVRSALPHRSTSLDTALNVPGGYLHFTTGGDCPFSVEGTGSSAVAASGIEDGYVATTLTMAENSSLFSNYVEAIAIDDQTGEVFFGTDKGLCSYMSDLIVKAETEIM